jgi:O-antigen/teichoic acid export membrane protein
MVLSGVLSLRLEMAIPNAIEEHRARAIAKLGMATSSAIAALLVVLYWVPAAGVAIPALSRSYLPWTLSLSLLTAVFVILSQLYIWYGLYAGLGQRSLLQGLVATSSSLLLGAAGFASGLILGQCMGRLAAIGLMAKSLPHVGVTRIADRFQWRRLWRYPVLFMPAGILNSIGGQLPLLLTAAWFGAEAAGLLGISQRVLALPAAIVGLAISQVFLGRLAEVRRVGRPGQLRVTKGALRVLLPAGGAITAAAYVLAPLLEWLLGAEWTGA